MKRAGPSSIPIGAAAARIGLFDRSFASRPGSGIQGEPKAASVQARADGATTRNANSKTADLEGRQTVRLQRTRQTPEDCMDLIVTTGSAAVVIVSITSHEAMHGFAANWLGDPTAREQGRLTLNPLPHIDLVFTILMPAFLLLSGAGVIFGGAKPVPVNVSRLRHPRRDWAIVGAAGPLTNVALAVGLSALLALLLHGGVVVPQSRMTAILSIGIFVNALLAVFNLVPIPPLDGSRVLQLFLSGAALAAYVRLERYGLFVILALIFFFPPAQIFVSGAVRALTLAVTMPFGVAPAVDLGLRHVFGG